MPKHPPEVSCARTFLEGMVRKGNHRWLDGDASSVRVVLAVEEAPSPDQVNAVPSHHLLAQLTAECTPPS